MYSVMIIEFEELHDPKVFTAAPSSSLYTFKAAFFFQDSLTQRSAQV
jgi:hypothetical protein